MKIKRPQSSDLQRFAKLNHFTLSQDELEVFTKTISGALNSYDRLEQIHHKISGREIGKRRRGHFPSKRENPLGAWAWKCSIVEKTATGRKLVSKKIAVKDNVLVRGIPLRDGSRLFNNFTPSLDATIITRILGEGGEIVGKSTCEDLCVSGGSHTSYPSPVRNPRNPKFMAGGSSSGSAALLAAREVDLAIGADQAGSIRIPSSWCGVFGLKPTHGLVPYTGILGMDPVIDHTGPMANTVYDVALLLEVIAGRDGFDSRQINTPESIPQYTRNLRSGIGGLKVAVVKEGFSWDGVSEEDVDAKVRESAESFKKLGANVKEISIPMHRDGVHIWTGYVMERMWKNMVRPNGHNHSWSGWFDDNLQEVWSRSVKQNGNKLAETAKLIALVGNYLSDEMNGKYYGIARNLRQKLIQVYDKVFENTDLLLMPTTPQKARHLEKMNLQESIAATVINLHNTCAFNVTGHPALNVPCGVSKGLPVGLMLVGRYFDEPTILRAAYAFERSNK